MERSAAAAEVFVRCDEMHVASDKGAREAHYYLQRTDGTAVLAVVGKEKSPRHMAYEIRDRSLLTIAPISVASFKLRTRREVVDWLQSVIAVSKANMPSHPRIGSLENKYGVKSAEENLKDGQLRNLGHYTKDFSWLGYGWIDRKRRMHYKSFSRNGVVISVHEFVYVLVEEGKRLVAYLEDMYEDSEGHNMVSVRWFHKLDEVPNVLPHNSNDREIFFTPFLQDLSVECIDGLATVLSRQHFENFVTEAAYTKLEPFMCDREFEIDLLKPYDITKLEGYWKQEIFRHMDTKSSSNVFVKPLPAYDNLKPEGNCPLGIRPREKSRRLNNNDVPLPNARKQNFIGAANTGGSELQSMKGPSFPALSRKEQHTRSSPLYLAVGSQVEVLCQDSGIRGCWFRATIIKRRNDQIKVRYQDLQDAEDEAKNLEEWLSAYGVASSDGLGLRHQGRNRIRPSPPQPNRGRVSWVFDVGSVVDVWWHDGWWEGIVIQNDPESKFHVYFPGEKQKSIFSYGDLRHSQEWVGNHWEHLRERRDIVNSILSGGEETDLVLGEKKLPRAATCSHDEVACNNILKDSLSVKAGRFDSVLLEVADDKGRKVGLVRDLSSDELLAQLKWNSSKKRKRSGSSSQNPNGSIINGVKKPEVGSRSFEGFYIPASLKADHDNCKYIGDSLFSSSVAPPLTSLVMSM